MSYLTIANQAGVLETMTEFLSKDVGTPNGDTSHSVNGGRNSGLGERERVVKLSILMPAYNEDRTLHDAVCLVLNQVYPCPIELVVVDDGSENSVKDLLGDVCDPRLRLAQHPTNLGKGAALRHAAAIAKGTHIVPFDADLEYDPADLVSMLAPVLAGRCEVVYGTRLFGASTRFQSYGHRLANRLLTLAANVMFDAYISDLHTCLKLMPLDVFKAFPLRETGFGLDTEITARILRSGTRPFEVPVSYHSRSREQGKKIVWTDGIDCLRILARIRTGRPEELVEVIRSPESSLAVLPAQSTRRTPRYRAITRERDAERVRVA
jgi:glycosyltransferase involved in cell wall biosynthesis